MIGSQHDIMLNMKKNKKNQNSFFSKAVAKAGRLIVSKKVPAQSLEQKRADFSRMVTKDMSKLLIKLGER